MDVTNYFQESKLPLLFVTNNVCNKILRYEDCEELSSVSSGARGTRGGKHWSVYVTK